MLCSRRRSHAQFSFHKLIAMTVVLHLEQLLGGHGFGKGCAHIIFGVTRSMPAGCPRSGYKYSSTFLTISRIWNGRPLTFEKGIAGTMYLARIIVHSCPRFISGIITVSNPARTSPRFFGNGFRCRRCALETDLPSPCIFSTAEVIDP